MNQEFEYHENLIGVQKNKHLALDDKYTKNLLIALKSVHTKNLLIYVVIIKFERKKNREKI